jgi:adenylate kinase
MARLTGRRVCRSCGGVWHLTFSPPPASLICPRCGGSIYQRDDDGEAAASNRLRVYQAQTTPVISWYEARNLIKKVPAGGSRSEVEAAINRALQGVE